MSPEPESLVLQLLRDMRAEIGEMRAEMATKTDLAELRAEMGSLRAEVAAHFVQTPRLLDGLHEDLREQIADLRSTVVRYHTAVLDHRFAVAPCPGGIRL